MTNLFTYLSNWKLRYICALVVLLCLGYGNVWGATTTLAGWTFSSGTAGTNYPSNNTNFGATSGTMSTNSTFCMNGSGSTWNSATGKGYAFTSVSSVVITLKLNQKLAAGAQITLAADVFYNKAGNKPVGSYAITTKVGSAAASSTGVGTTTWTLSSSSANKTSTYTTQAEIASGTTIQFILTASGASGSGQAYFNNVTIKSTTYTVTYNANSGSGSVPTDATAYCSKAIVTVKGNTGPVSRSGYEFGGWNTQADGNGTNYTAGSGTFTINSDVTLHAKWTAAASCTANPTAGGASLNGSFNMTSTTSSIGVSSGTCSTGNAACDWTDYGFVWSDGANTTTPTVGGTNCNKVQVGTTGNGTSWTGSITPSGSTTPTTWTTGHTYYVRTYGKNSKAGAAFVEGSAWSFTPYMVTFNKNDGGATTSTQYVQGGVSTNLTSNSFSKTGYTFNGWNTDADGTSGTGYTNGQSVSLSANLTLYAKWNANTFYVRFNKNNNDATGTMSNQTFTYDVAQNLTANAFSLTGYTFAGWATTSGGTVAHTDEKSVSNLTSTAGGTVDLYAKWTIKNYTVTWKVNGEDYTAGTPTDNVNHGSHVTTLPTAPSPASYCGDKFMGWTDADGGVYTHGTSNLYTKASDFPNATGNQVFYAVFANYVVAP